MHLGQSCKKAIILHISNKSKSGTFKNVYQLKTRFLISLDGISKKAREGDKKYLEMEKNTTHCNLENSRKRIKFAQLHT